MRSATSLVKGSVGMGIFRRGFMPVRKPSWGLLYLIVPLAAGLVLVEHDLVLSLLGHELVQLGIVVIVFGLMLLWVRANAQEIVSGTKGESTPERLHWTVYEASEPERNEGPVGSGHAVRARRRAKASGTGWNARIERNN